MIYRAGQGHCRRFLGSASADLRGGPRRNFQVFSALDFPAEVTPHIPEKGTVIAEGQDVTYDMKPNRDDPTAAGTREMAAAIRAKL